MSQLSTFIMEAMFKVHKRFPPFSVLLNFDILCEAIGRDDPATAEAFADILETLIKLLPEHYLIDEGELHRQHRAWPEERYSAMTVPLYDIIDVGRLIIEIHHHIIYQLGEAFYPLRKQLLDNENDYHGINAYQRRKTRVPIASEVDEEPEEPVRAYLKHTPFRDLFYTQVPFRIPRKAFAEHGAIFAKSGHGKTQTLRAIIAGFLNEPDPPALFIMDSLGSLIDGIADLEVFTSTLRDRLVILDPSDPRYCPSLNFFELQSDDLCFYLFKAIDQSFTPRQATMISYLMEFMRCIPDATFLTLIQVCEGKENPYPEAVEHLSPFAKSFFENQFYGKKIDQLVQQTKSQIAARIYTLARLPKFQEMFTGTSGVLFDPFRCMQEKKIVLVNTDARPPRQGGLGEASSVFGRFILAQCLDAARGRPKNERHLALLVVDEAKAYMDEQSALILSDARQFGLGLLLSSQFPHQLEEGVRREINTNTSIRFMGPVEYAVASQYARDMFTTPEHIMAMQARDLSHAEWAVYVSNLTSRAMTVRVPYGAMERMEKAASPALAPRASPQSPRYQAPVKKAEPARPPPSETPAPKPASSFKELPTSKKIVATDEPLIKPGKDWD